MSKQPGTGNGMLSRLRRPAVGLRDLTIWSKLGLIMIVPTLATVIVGANGLIGHVQAARDADRARSLATLAEASGDLVHGLQDERAAAVILLGTSNQAAKQTRLAAYRGTHAAVNAARGSYLQRGEAISGLPANFGKSLDEISRKLDGLGEIRQQVEAGKVTLSSAKDWYQLLINNLLTVGDSSAPLAGDSDLSDRMRAAAAIAREKEFLSLQRTVVLNAFSMQEMTPKLKRDFIATRTGQEQALQSFQSVANASERTLYEQTVSGSALREATSRTGNVEELVGTSVSALPFDVAEWDSALIGHARLLRDVQKQLNQKMVSEATDLRDDVTRTVIFETSVLLSMLLLAILFAWLVARSMARSLRELRQGALSVAQFGLPQAVAKLRDPALSASMSPQQVATQIAEPLPVRTKDEFGQVTEAFNAVHLEAVRIAAEQAALRASVATMFVNLARRSQILVDRLIGHLDRLERGEEDPDALAELFQLDHLATRMRRNDENLLVLAGADSTRVQRDPASLLDVLRAAQSEVEHYTRIEFGTIDRDIEVSAHAVNDLVHLLAELFDNATAFSSPDSNVTVEAHRVGEQAKLYVEDHGIGISAEQLAELNERLATPPVFDVTVSRMMGLVVVSRLAARHGVKVELRRAVDRGTVADVTLPASVLIPRSITERSSGTSYDAAGDSISAPGGQRAPFGPPLALEGGPKAAGGRSPYESAGAFSTGPGSGGTVPPTRSSLLGPAAASRAMPAWSDLTGASSAPSANGSGGPGHNGTPGSPGLAGGTAFSPPGPGRGTNEPFAKPEPFAPRPPDQPGPGMASPPAGDPWTADGEIAESQTGPVVPRQMPIQTDPRTGLPRRPVPSPGLSPSDATAPISIPPVSAPPMPPPGVAVSPAEPDASASPATAPGGTRSDTPSSPPPTWPPIAPDSSDDAEPPAVPEELAAALDMTAELPKVRPVAEPEAAPQPEPQPEPQPAPADPPRSSVSPPPAPDETMELPIFRELESAWFRTRRPAAGSDGPFSTPQTTAMTPLQTTAVPPPATSGRDPASPAWQEPASGDSDARSNTMYGTTAGSNSMVGTPMPASGSSWRTAADDGWRAASAASEVPVTETTAAGLPKRTPMAQLVPGGIERPAAAAQRRTPEGVRGLLSAYHRGVQRGRSEPKDDYGRDINPEPTTAGPQQEGGKEQEA